MYNKNINHHAYCEGDKLFKAGCFKEASQNFILALENWSEDWQAMMALGNCYSEMHKHSKSEAMFRIALDHCPEKAKPDLLFNLGNALYDLGKYREAIAIYDLIPKGHARHEKVSRNLRLAKDKL